MMKERKSGLRRIFVLLLTAVLVGNAINFCALSVSARTAEEQTAVNTIFGELLEAVSGQSLPGGTEESNMNFPGTLTVTIEKIESDEVPKAGDGSIQNSAEAGKNVRNLWWNIVIGTMVIVVSFYAFFAVKKKTKDV